MYKILISFNLLSLITPCQMQPSFSSRSAKGNFLLSSANFFVFVFRFPFFPTDSGVPAKFLGGRKKNPFPSFPFLPYSNLIRLRSLAPCPLPLSLLLLPTDDDEARKSTSAEEEGRRALPTIPARGEGLDEISHKSGGRIWPGNGGRGFAVLTTVLETFKA